MKRNVKTTLMTILLALGTLFAAGCGSDPAPKTVIYTNADEEAQNSMKAALDKNGFENQYIMQSFGTAELGGKLMAEGKKIEADLITMSSYYVGSAQQANQMFTDLTFSAKPLTKQPSYAFPTTGQSGAIFINTEVLAKNNLPAPKSLRDLANPIYKNLISIPDIKGSSTAWLLVQAVFGAYGEEEGAKIVKSIMTNAGPHLENSGSAPLKKLRAGEVAIGFGLRHQAVADKKKGLPIDYIDPEEGNYILTESVAVINKTAEKNAQAMKMADVIIKEGRKELIKYYPTALYEGETVDSVDKPANPKEYKEALTVELLKKHQSLLQ